MYLCVCDGQLYISVCVCIYIIQAGFVKVHISSLGSSNKDVQVFLLNVGSRDQDNRESVPYVLPRHFQPYPLSSSGKLLVVVIVRLG